jgi:ligand-binding sensor domain-containing protein/DNA-binding CsgD family transcriptional regulator
MKFRLPGLLLSLFLATGLPAQTELPSLGTPVIRNFSKEIYRGGTQNWGAVQDSSGLIWLANNQGLLEFDGQNWRNHPLPNRTIVRSVCTDRSGRLYAGGQGEVGLLAPDRRGAWQYRSLLEQLPAEERLFEDVWNLTLSREALYFRASGHIYRLPLDSGRAGEQLALPGDALFLGKLPHGGAGQPGGAGYAGVAGQPGSAGYAGGAERLLIQVQGMGLLEWGLDRDGNPRPGGAELIHPSTQNLGDITAIMPADGGKLLIATLKAGLFILDSLGLQPLPQADQDYLTRHRIYCALQMRDGRIALGTASGGLVLLSAKGELLARYTRRQGLLNNTVLALMEDQSGHLWLGLDNGISMLAASSPFSRFYPDGDLEGTAYAIKLVGRELYCGTNNGLYVMSLDEGPDARAFERIPGSEGQVWSLHVLGGQLLMGHHEGAFLVSERKLLKLGPQAGVWTFIPLEFNALGQPTRLLAGTYSGLFSLTWVEGWQYEGPVEGFGESARFIALDRQRNIWIAHPYRGAWRARLEGQRLEALRFLGKEQGLPSDLGIQLYAVWDDVVFSAEQGTWTFDAGSDRFVPHNMLDSMLGSQSRVQRLIASAGGDLWYAIGTEVGRIAIDDKGLYKVSRRVVFPELRAELVGGFEYIEDVPGDQVFFATDRGIVHYNPSTYNPAPEPRLLFRAIESYGRTDTLLYLGAGGTSGLTPPRLPSRNRALRFSFAALEYEYPERMRYSWQLQGFDADWSAWSEKTEKEFTNLKPGSYTFLVRTQDMHGRISEPAAYTFSIAAPWHASNLAYALYALALAISLGLLIVIPQRRFAQDKREMVSEQQRTIREQEERHRQMEAEREQEIMRLRTDKLQGELAHQNGQLATTTLHLVQKNALIVKLREDLEKLEKLSDPAERRKAIKQLMHILNDDERLDEDWDHFALHFDKVHADFLARLRDRFPNLTPKDHKLCAFLRMNLSSKEIAPLLYISTRGVEISRYRLRKKLGLDTEANLTEFLQGL